MIKFIPDPKYKELIESFEKLPAGTKAQMRRGLYIAGKSLTVYLKKEMTKKGRSGKIYKIYRGLGGRLLKRPRYHQASAPHEFPAVITGEYRKSIDFKILGNKKMEFGSTSNYSGYLENGTEIMKPRKPLGRTAIKLRDQINSVILKQINKGMKKYNFNVKKN